MLLLELTTLTSSSRSKKMGLIIDEDDLIEVRTSINIDSITHLSEHPDDNRLTNIYLTSGGYVTSPASFNDIRSLLEPEQVDNQHIPFNSDHVKYKL